MTNFEEIAILGKGSFGSVIEVVDINSHESFAIKKIESDKDFRIEFIKEYLNYSLITKLDSSYLVKHFDLWFEEIEEENDTCVSIDNQIQLYIQMELCDKTLEEVINDFEKYRILTNDGLLTTIGYYLASQIFIEILLGVDYLHKQNPSLIHRDLKSANILLKKCAMNENFVKIADFGLMAIHKFPDQSHTKDKGTPKYMAPEVRKSSYYNTKADIYSLGFILEKTLHLQIDG
jgi:serine/threonine protein kinase